MFGISFGELLLIGVVTLVIVGPDKLPKMLGTLGRWMAKLRSITTEVRHQTGIDELLREEGLKGGLNELRGLVRGGAVGTTLGALASATNRPKPRAGAPATQTNPLLATPNLDPYKDVPHDRSREYPQEGCDSYGCLPDDLYREPDDDRILAPAPLAGGSGANEPSAPPQS